MRAEVRNLFEMFETKVDANKIRVIFLAINKKPPSGMQLTVSRSSLIKGVKLRYDPQAPFITSCTRVYCLRMSKRGLWLLS